MKTNNNEVPRELLLLAGIYDWEQNPRRGEYRNIEAFAEQIARDGGLKDDLHVFMLNGVVTAINGHRRKRAAPLAGIEMAWVRNYGAISEREAFELLMTLNNGQDPFDSRELAIAAQTGVHHMGMTAAEVARIFHRNEETVQLYLDLDTLPMRVKEAVYDKKLTLEIAEMFLQLPTAAMQEKALGEVLCSGPLKEPMSTKQAQVHLEENYLKPVKRAAEWEKLKKKLLAKYPLDEGFSYVSYEASDDFVMTETREIGEFARADSWVPSELLVDPAEPLKWDFLRTLYGVPVFVCPALGLPEKYLLLVAIKAVKDSDAMAEAPLLRGRAGKVKKAKVETVPQPEGLPQGTQEPGGASGPLPVSGDTVADPEALQEHPPFPMARLDRIMAVFLGKKDKILGDACWKEMVSVLASLGALHLPPSVHETLTEKMEQDTSQNRRGMRVCMGWLLALGVQTGRPLDGFNPTLEAVEEAIDLPPME